MVACSNSLSTSTGSGIKLFYFLSIDSNLSFLIVFMPKVDMFGLTLSEGSQKTRMEGEEKTSYANNAETSIMVDPN